MILEWLFAKAQAYEQQIRNLQNGTTLAEAAELEEEEELFEEYEAFDPEAEQEDPFEIFAEKMTKQENREFLKFNKIKS